MTIPSASLPSINPAPGPAGATPQPLIPPPAALLEAISLRHDADVCIGRFLLQAEHEVRALGVSLEFGSFEELRACNARHRSTWRPLVPVLDESLNSIDPHRSFCILGRDQDGNVVATQAARLFDYQDSSLQLETESLRLFYGSAPPDDLSALLTAPSARSITGNVVYSGGVWYHPKFRGLGLASLLPRLSRALAVGMWAADFVVSFVEEALLKKNMSAAYGYPRFERHFLLTDERMGDVLFAGGLIWISRSETIADLRSRLSTSGPEVNVVPHARRA